jgi:hypothetical protein
MDLVVGASKDAAKSLIMKLGRLFALVCITIECT